jgi:hypothetical protein
MEIYGEVATANGESRGFHGFTAGAFKPRRVGCSAPPVGADVDQVELENFEVGVWSQRLPA